MAERESSFRVAFDGDASNLGDVLTAIKRQVKGAVGELEQTTARVELFKGTSQKVDETRAAMEKLTASAGELRAQIKAIEDSGGKVGADLTASLKSTESQLAKTSKEFDKHSATLAKLQAQLTKAGVDTSKLAAEETRLAAATSTARKEQDLLAAQQLLGIKSSKAAAAEIAKLNAAYQTLRASGATAAELALAQKNLGDRIKELQAPTGGLATQFGTLRGSFLAAAGAIGAIVIAFKEASQAAIEHEKSLARIGSVTNLTAAQLGKLGDEVTELSAELGINLQDALNATYTLLRQGFPSDSIKEFLKIADSISDTGLADFQQGIKLASGLIRGFGLSMAEIPGALDALSNSARHGGATLGEFADNMGDIAPLARATRTSFLEVEAAVEKMIAAGLDAPTAFGAVQQALTRLANPDTQERLRGLGITVDGLAGTFDQINAKGIPVGEIIDLGVVSARAAPGVAALTNDTSGLADAVARMQGASGEFEKISQAAGNTSSKALESLVASVQALVIALGEMVAPTADVIKALASIVQGLTAVQKKIHNLLGTANEALPSVFSNILSMLNPLGSLKGMVVALGNDSDRLRAQLKSTGEAAKDAGAAVSDSAKQIGDSTKDQIAAAQQTLASLTSQLSAMIPTLQAASKAIASMGTDAIATINQEAAAQIAALDKLELSESAHAKNIVAIRTDAAAATLQVINQTARDAIAATDAEAEARLVIARKTPEQLQKVELEIAQNKRDVLKTITQAYQQHLNGLLQLERDHLKNIAALDQQRIDVNADIDSRIRTIIRQSLTAYDQYADKVKEIDETIAKARDSLVAGNTKQAEKYAQKAIDLVNGIAGEVKEGNQVVVDSVTAQKVAVDKLEKARGILNDTIDAQQTAEKNAAKEVQQSRVDTENHLATVKQQLDDITADVAKGIDVAVTIDAKTAVDKARAEIMSLDGLTVTAKLRLEQQTVEGHAAGGLVGQATRGMRSASAGLRGVVQRFATGGPVFRKPTWSKVPGSGNGDTVPAGLQAGSFVVRKAASRYYGDSLLGSLNRAQHFAAGGLASPLTGGAASSLPMLGRKLSDIVLGGSLGGLGGGRKVDGVDLQKLQRELTAIQEAGRSLPHSSTGLDVGKWAAALLERIPFLTDAKLKVLADFVDNEVEGILAGIMQARSFGVPSVVGEQLLGWLFLNRGGPARGTDTVPAMLTPGEWVIRKPAVDHFGAGLLSAINSMRIPREALARLVAPPARPRYFADGGPVKFNGGPRNASRSDPVNSQPVTVNIYTTEKLTPEAVRRNVIPVLRDEIRRKF